MDLIRVLDFWAKLGCTSPPHEAESLKIKKKHTDCVRDESLKLFARHLKRVWIKKEGNRRRCGDRSLTSDRICLVKSHFLYSFGVRKRRSKLSPPCNQD
ncbi:hypothetical protein AMECASPLE_005599 [Ameca splendens]|uniref:Uncharacterized protein n=1 Tax=Ameca splendens TaxID=208324 RepID=A0ABV0XC71_9TELE